MRRANQRQRGLGCRFTVFAQKATSALTRPRRRRLQRPRSARPGQAPPGLIGTARRDSAAWRAARPAKWPSSPPSRSTLSRLRVVRRRLPSPPFCRRRFWRPWIWDNGRDRRRRPDRPHVHVSDDATAARRWRGRPAAVGRAYTNHNYPLARPAAGQAISG